MKKLSREEENELRGQDPEAYLQYYYALRERFEASVLYNLSLKTRRRIHLILLSGCKIG